MPHKVLSEASCSNTTHPVEVWCDVIQILHLASSLDFYFMRRLGITQLARASCFLL